MKPKKDKIPSGTSWKKILHEIYVNAPHGYGASIKRGFYDDKHVLAKKLKITGDELMLGIYFIEDNKLIKK